MPQKYSRKNFNNTTERGFARKDGTYLNDGPPPRGPPSTAKHIN